MLQRESCLLFLLALVTVGACGVGAATPPAWPASPPVTGSSDAQAAVDYTQPVDRRVVGTGLVEAFTLDGNAIIVSDEDQRFSKRGCEGLPEDVLLRVPFDGGQREPIGTADGDPLKGHFRRTSGGRVAVVEDCEEYLGRIFVAREAPEGWLGQVVEVREQEGRWPKVAEIVVWSASPTHLLAATVTATNANYEPTEFAVVRIAVPSGTVEELFRTGDPVFQVGQFSDGRVVSAGEGRVRVHGAPGKMTNEYEGDGFAIGPDGSLAILAEGLTVVPPSGGPARVLAPPKPGARVIQAGWAPGAEAVAYIRRGDKNESVEIVTMEGTVTELAKAAAWRLAFSPDGRQLAFSQLRSEPTEPADAVVLRFGAD
jgi:hypothetical protein